MVHSKEREDMRWKGNSHSSFDAFGTKELLIEAINGDSPWWLTDKTCHPNGLQQPCSPNQHLTIAIPCSLRLYCLHPSPQQSTKSSYSHIITPPSTWTVLYNSFCIECEHLGDTFYFDIKYSKLIQSNSPVKLLFNSPVNYYPTHSLLSNYYPTHSLLSATPPVHPKWCPHFHSAPSKSSKAVCILVVMRYINDLQIGLTGP